MRTAHGNPWRPMATRLAVTVCALAVAAVHLMRPTAKIDGVLLGLLAVAVVPWLGSVFESVEGGGMKVTYQKLERDLESTREDLQATQGELQVTKGELQVTQGAVESTRHRAEFIESKGVPGIAPGSPVQEMRQLVSEYDRIRREMTSGPQRTRKMTDVVRHLTLLASSLDDIDWPAYLRSPDGGERIAAYSYYFVSPDPQAARDLTYALTNVDGTPFGQFWAIQALGKIAEVAPASVLELVPVWRDFLATLRKGTDRYYELSQLISSLSPARGQ
jgi:hypothetical protein